PERLGGHAPARRPAHPGRLLVHATAAAHVAHSDAFFPHSAALARPRLGSEHRDLARDADHRSALAAPARSLARYAAPGPAPHRPGPDRAELLARRARSRRAAR